MVDQRRLQERGIWARLNLGRPMQRWLWVNNGGSTTNLTTSVVRWGLGWEREREREEREIWNWTGETILFLFKFLIGRVSFYGLVNVEPKLKPKAQIFNTKRPVLDPSGHSDWPVGLWVGSSWTCRSGLMEWWITLSLFIS